MLTLQHNSLYLLVVAAITACVTVGPSWQAPSGMVSPAETQAMAAAVEALAAKSGKAQQTLVIREATLPVTRKKSMTFPQKASDLRTQLPELDEPLFEAFRKANRKSYLIDQKSWPLPPGKRRIVAESVITTSFRTGGWARFRQDYGSSAQILGLSRLGVDKDRQRALLYYTLTAGPEEGRGGFLLLQNAGDGWRVTQTVTQWTS